MRRHACQAKSDLDFNVYTITGFMVIGGWPGTACGPRSRIPAGCSLALGMCRHACHAVQGLDSRVNLRSGLMVIGRLAWHCICV